MLHTSARSALLILIFALISAGTSGARAEFFGCDDQHRTQHVSYSSAPSYRAGAFYTNEFAAQSHPRITIHPRHEAQRHCRSWLAKEYRVSGPVIVPRMRCWWE
jgi:hypothetical protein